MRLTVERLGRIKHAEMDIRPLTVFVGHNNTNKTWTAYSLYGMARRLSATKWVAGRTPASVNAVVASEQILRNRLEATTERILERIRVAGDADVTIEVTREELLRDIAPPWRFSIEADDIREILRIPAEFLQDAAAALVLDVSDVDRFSTSLSVTRSPRSGLVQGFYSSPDRGDVKFRQFEFYASSETELREFVQVLIGRALRPLDGQVVVFPAERKALVTMFKLLRPEFESVLSQPVVDYAEFLRITELEPLVDNAQVPLLTRFEQSVLNGRVVISASGAGTSLGYQMNGGAPLPIHTASSLVRALAGFDLYLQRRALVRDILIIDEPEMNAHPEAQFAIVELLALLVRGGARIVITTHSPYIVDHINNLIAAGRLTSEQQEAIAGRFKLGDPLAFISSESVSAYEFHDDGTVTDIVDRAEGLIDWSTFGRATDYVGNLYSDILAVERQRP